MSRQESALKGAISILKKDGQRVDVMADTFGSLAVHRTIEGSLWAISHVPTGGQIVTFKYKRDAVKLARDLSGLADWALVEPGCEIMVDSDSGGLKAWQKKAIVKAIESACLGPVGVE